MFPLVAVCLTCKNASDTLECTLQSIASLNYARERLIVIVVDGGSNDGTTDIAKKILDSLDLKHEIIVKPSNIPEGRNICISRALEIGAEYIFFVDSDVIIVYSDILTELIRIDKEYGPCVINASRKHKIFSNLEELRTFCNRVTKLDGSTMLSARVVRWCGMGLTLIPRRIAEQVRFDEDMTFAEDRYYGYLVWKSGYKVYSVNADKPLAYDVNLPKRSDIYVNMSIGDYFRGLYKKAFMVAYTYYDGSILKTMAKLLKDVAGKRILFHSLIMLVLIAGLVMFFATPLQLWGLALITLYIAIDLTYLVRLWKVKCRNILQALANLFKFRIYGFYVGILIPIITLKHKKQLKLHSTRLLHSMPKSQIL